jgi:hypothetical protein
MTALTAVVMAIALHMGTRTRMDMGMDMDALQTLQARLLPRLARPWS